jgi:hypothetical protein
VREERAAPAMSSRWKLWSAIWASECGFEWWLSFEPDVCRLGFDVSSAVVEVVCGEAWVKRLRLARRRQFVLRAPRRVVGRGERGVGAGFEVGESGEEGL